MAFIYILHIYMSFKIFNQHVIPFSGVDHLIKLRTRTWTAILCFLHLVSSSSSGFGVVHSRSSMYPLLLWFLSISKMPHPHSTPVSSAGSIFIIFRRLEACWKTLLWWFSNLRYKYVVGFKVPNFLIMKIFVFQFWNT